MAFLRRSFKGNAASTTLSSGINASVTSFTVAAGGGAGYPTGGAGNFFVVIDRGLTTEEKILCSSRATDAFTVAASGRGVDDTVGQAHSAGASVEHCITATDVDEANNWVSQLSAAVTAKGDNPIATAANTLGKLAVGADNTVRIADSSQATGQKWALIGAASIATDAVGSAQIAADAVGASEIATDAVGSAEIAANAVGSSELADTAVDTAAIQDAAVTEAKLAANIIMTGDYKWSAQTADHGNWLKCEGGAVSRTGANTALFALVGTAFGVGNGSTTFNLPDARGRSPMAVGTGSGLTARALGASSGTETATLSTTHLAAHTHAGTDHLHNSLGNVGLNYVYLEGGNSGGLTLSTGGTPGQVTGSADRSLTTGSSGSGTAFSIMQPYLAIGSLFIHT